MNPLEINNNWWKLYTTRGKQYQSSHRVIKSSSFGAQRQRRQPVNNGNRMIIIWNGYENNMKVPNHIILYLFCNTFICLCAWDPAQAPKRRQGPEPPLLWGLGLGLGHQNAKMMWTSYAIETQIMWLGTFTLSPH